MVRLQTFLLTVFAVWLLACNNPSANTAATINSDSAWGLQSFVKADGANPVMIPDSSQTFVCPVMKAPVQWEAKNVFNPAAVMRNDTVFLLYRAQDGRTPAGGTSRIGLAWSTDGLQFTKHPTPVLYPDNDAYKTIEWEGGCEDPRMVQDASGTYYMTYTSYDGKVARLLMATSTDLYHWTKHGPVFAKAHSGKYKDFWSKSGSIVSRYDGGKMVAEKIGGKYWMYWGDQNIWLATSDDLINWAPVLDSSGKRSDAELRGIAAKAPELKIAFAPRPKKFDSDLVEPGPPAMLTDEGILLLYNSRNVPAIGDSSLPEGTYCPAQILFDKTDPGKMLKRADTYFMKPEKPYEITGQVGRVCFVEGLVQHKGKWFLYYGTADSKIAAAIAEPPNH